MDIKIYIFKNMVSTCEGPIIHVIHQNQRKRTFLYVIHMIYILKFCKSSWKSKFLTGFKPIQPPFGPLTYSKFWT